MAYSFLVVAGLSLGSFRAEDQYILLGSPVADVSVPTENVPSPRNVPTSGDRHDRVGSKLGVAMAAGLYSQIKCFVISLSESRRN